jgi:hypothetical protein
MCSASDLTKPAACMSVCVYRCCMTKLKLTVMQRGPTYIDSTSTLTR